MSKVKIIALFYDSESDGLEGWIGAITPDGKPLGLCSKEKWDGGYVDSLRTGWKNNIKIFNVPKIIHMNEQVTLKELKQDFISWKLTVPNSLKYLLK